MAARDSLQGDTEQLRELLPLALYGKAPARGFSDASSTAQVDQTQCLDKCLQLLQLSCQYAHCCTDKLDANARFGRARGCGLGHSKGIAHGLAVTSCSALERTRTRLVRRKAQLQATRRQMELHERNVRRELKVLDSSLDGMRMLLQALDPDCIERLDPVGDSPSS